MPSNEPIFSTRRLPSTLEHPRRRRGGQNLSCSTWRTRSGLNLSGKKNILVHFRCCHLRFQGLTGERRYTKSPPKTRSSIFSSKPYNASQYVPSFSSKVSFKFLLLTDNKKTPITPNPPTPGSFPANARADTWRSGGCKEIATGRQPLHRQGFENQN